MSGLLAKDLLLIQKRKLFFLIMLMLGYIIGVLGANDFVVGYLTILGAMYTFSTVSYDEADDGLSFLMTMPVNSRIYIIEKMIFIFAHVVISWVIGFIFLLLGSYYRDAAMGDLSTYLIFIPLGMFMIAFCLPMQLKFGAERSRVIMILFVGLAFAGIYFAETFFSIEVDLEGMNALSEQTIAGLIFLISAVSVVISSIISIHILNKKEY